MKKGNTYQEKFVVNEFVYNKFISAFNDKNPLHTNDDFAKQKGFREKIMHGNILGGFLSFFIGECLPNKNVIIHSQEIKYLNPIFLNDTIILDTRIEDVFESVNVIEFSFEFKNQEQKKIAKGKINIGLI